MAIDGVLQHALYEFPPSTDEIRFRTADAATPLADAQQPMGGQWFLGTLDHLRSTESRRAIDQPRC